MYLNLRLILAVDTVGGHMWKSEEILGQWGRGVSSSIRQGLQVQKGRGNGRTSKMGCIK